MSELLHKLDALHHRDQHQAIVNTIEQLPHVQQDYEVMSRYARALNNLSRYQEAVAILENLREKGVQDSLWNFRMGYSLFYLDLEVEAITYLQKAIELGDTDEDTKWLLAEAKGTEEQESSLDEEDDTSVEFDPDCTIDGSSYPVFDEALLLEDMFNDDYYPNFLVDKIKALLVEVIVFIYSDERTYGEVQEKLDEAICSINDLQQKFEEHDSEIETVARDSIGESVERILTHFEIELGIEHAIRNREW